jgi:hypothetical protein
VTSTEYWRGHAGCARVKRRYTLPGRGKSKPAAEEITLNLTRDQIAAKIAAMGGAERVLAKLGWR